MPFGMMSGLRPSNSVTWGWRSPMGKGNLTPLWIANWTGPCSGVHTRGADAWLQALDKSAMGCEGVGGIAYRGRSLISTIALFYFRRKYVRTERLKNKFNVTLVKNYQGHGDRWDLLWKSCDCVCNFWDLQCSCWFTQSEWDSSRQMEQTIHWIQVCNIRVMSKVANLSYPTCILAFQLTNDDDAIGIPPRSLEQEN